MTNPKPSFHDAPCQIADRNVLRLITLLRLALAPHKEDGVPATDFDSTGLFADVTPEAWEQLYALSCQQNVVAVAADGILLMPPDLRPPLTVWLQWVGATRVTEDAYIHKYKVLKQLFHFFNQQGIPTLLLKGMTIARLYPHPNHRTMGDIDIYQFGRWREADRLMVRHFGIAVDNSTRHHSKYALCGELIENHYDIVSGYSHYGQRSYERMLKQEARQVAAQHGTITSRSGAWATFEALLLLRHAATHFVADCITLRHLCDWALFVEHRGSEVDWQRVEESMRHYRMERFFAALQNTTETWIGLGTLTAIAHPADKTLEQRMIHDITAGGYSEPRPESRHRLLGWKWRRLIANRWKYPVTFGDSFALSVLRNIILHLLRPRSLWH